VKDVEADGGQREWMMSLAGRGREAAGRNECIDDGETKWMECKAFSFITSSSSFDSFDCGAFDEGRERERNTAILAIAPSLASPQTSILPKPW
jgi:hypothetical protein